MKSRNPVLPCEYHCPDGEPHYVNGELYFALKFQLIHPNPVMAYMMLISTGKKKLDKARSIVIKKFCEPYCWENRHR